MKPFISNLAMFSASNRVPPPDRYPPANGLRCHDGYRLAFSQSARSSIPCCVTCKIPPAAESQMHSQCPDVGAISFRSIHEDSHPLSPIKGTSIQILLCFSNSKNSIRLTDGEITTDYPFVVGNVLTEFLVSLLGRAVIPLNFSMSTAINFLLENNLSGWELPTDDQSIPYFCLSFL
jgi:hypothetical protein